MYEIKGAFAMLAAFVASVIILAGLWVGGGFLGLWWYPYSIQQQTAIVRNSNSYVTTKQEELVTLLVGYGQATTDPQKRAIILAMCQDAALIPGYVPMAVSHTIAGECGR